MNTLLYTWYTWYLFADVIHWKKTISRVLIRFAGNNLSYTDAGRCLFKIRKLFKISLLWGSDRVNIQYESDANKCQTFESDTFVAAGNSHLRWRTVQWDRYTAPTAALARLVWRQSRRCQVRAVGPWPQRPHDLGTYPRRRDSRVPRHGVCHPPVQAALHTPTLAR